MRHFSDHFYDIKTFKYWTLILHKNQSYLGRVICYLHAGKENLIELSTDEYLELLEIIKIYQAALVYLWSPNWWNYAQLGNNISHLHIHFIPRYETKRIFAGQEFFDERWGKNYAPAPERVEDKSLNKKIIIDIQKAIDKINVRTGHTIR